MIPFVRFLSVEIIKHESALDSIIVLFMLLGALNVVSVKSDENKKNFLNYFSLPHINNYDILAFIMINSDVTIKII
jgi:hypothetical protein